MEKRDITIEEAKKVWEQVKDNQFTLSFYPTFEDYWKECEKINNLPDHEWHTLINSHQKKFDEMAKIFEILRPFHHFIKNLSQR